jgi:hypothetical protein
MGTKYGTAGFEDPEGTITGKNLVRISFWYKLRYHWYGFWYVHWYRLKDWYYSCNYC